MATSGVDKKLHVEKYLVGGTNDVQDCNLVG